MTRVTSHKKRQYTFVVDGGIDPGITPDEMALFLPDGTPIDLTADPSKMKWVGTWSVLSSYVLNDVVLDSNDNGLYIVTADTILAGQPRPSTPNASWQLIFKAPPGGGFKGTFDAGTTYPAGSIVLYNGSLWATDIPIPSGGNAPNETPDAISRTLGIAGARTIGRYTGPTGWTGTSTTDTNNNAYRYFELLVGGTVTFTGGLFAGWDNAGTFTYSNFSGAKALTAGLWIFSCQGGPGVIALSGGAVLKTSYPPNWTLLRKPDIPVGGAIDDILAKASTVDRDVKWLTRPVPSRDTRANRASATPSLGRLWSDTDTGVTYIGDGTNWQIFNSHGLVRRTSDFTLPQSDTTISGGDQIISFNAEANSVWIVEALLRLQGVSNLADVKFDFGITSGTYEMLSGLDALGVPAAGSPVAVSGATPIEFGLLNGTTFARLQALIMLGAGLQSVSLRGAQVTSQAENVKVLTNSALLLRRLA